MQVLNFMRSQDLPAREPSSYNEKAVIDELLAKQDDPALYCGENADYAWVQTADEIEVSVQQVDGTNLDRKAVAVEFHNERVLVIVQNKVILDGLTPQPIDPDESHWVIERKAGMPAAVVVTLTKKKRTTKAKDHWRSVVKGHKEVDQAKIGPQIIRMDGNDPESVRRAVAMANKKAD